MKGLCLLFALCLLPGTAQARAVVAVPHTRPLTLECMADAAQEYAVPLAALVGILAVEGGTVGEAQRNANGSWDLGSFQVNTCNLNELAAQGYAPDAILRDGCVNASAAARILRREYLRAGDLWTAIGGYHSKTPQLHAAYVARVRKHLVRLGNAIWPGGVQP